MKRFLKILAGAWLTGAVMGGGCFCGAVASGLIVQRRGPTMREEWTQAQIDQLREDIASMARANIYDYIAANPQNEEGGL